MKFSCVLLAGCAFGLAMFCGCSGGGPPTETVSGTVTFEGQPVADAQIGFVPNGGGEQVKGAFGQTDTDGHYSLRTYVKPGQEVGGAMIGTFQVTVTKAIAENQIVEYDDIAKAKDEVPPRYADAATTPLSASVTVDGENVFDFALE